jgi:hypothetical protein
MVVLAMALVLVGSGSWPYKTCDVNNFLTSLIRGAGFFVEKVVPLSKN